MSAHWSRGCQNLSLIFKSIEKGFSACYSCPFLPSYYNYYSAQDTKPRYKNCFANYFNNPLFWWSVSVQRRAMMVCLLQLLLCWRYQAKIGQDIKVVSQTTKLLLFWLAVPLCLTIKVLSNKVLRWALFIKQNLRFGLVWNSWAI